MDGLTGLYAKLKNTDIPLEERIELSRKILANSDSLLPNKNQVIVDWLFQELANIRSSRGNKRVKNGSEFVEHETELWKILSEILNDPASEQIVLRGKILPILFKELDEIRSIIGKSCSENGGLDMTEDRILFVFLCFQAVSKSPNMSLTFFNKLENLEQCLKGILACFLGVLLQPNLHSASFFEELFHLAGIVLYQYSTAQQQQVSCRKLFTSLCDKLLQLLLLVRAAMKNVKVFHCKELRWDEIVSAIDVVIVSGLFHKDLVSNYHPTASPCEQGEPSPKKPKLVNPYNQLFDVLKRLAKGYQEGIVMEDTDVKPDLVCQAISTSLPFLVERFMKAAGEDMKLDNASKFSFFVELYQVISLSDYFVGQVPDVIRIDILNKMLQLIVDHDVYQIAEDNNSDRPIFKWLSSLVKNELRSESYDDELKFRCLDIILRLNHKIIEQTLEIVLAKCFIKSKQVSKAKIDLLCNVIETYSKLQQMENLVKCILKVFNTLGNEFGTIPVDVLARLSRSFEHRPFNQTLSILQLFLDELKEKVNSMEQEDGHTDGSLEGISILCVTFLLNSSYNAAETRGLDQKKVTKLKELVGDIKVAIIMPFIRAFPGCEKASQNELGFSILYLIYGLNSLVQFLRQHDVITTSDDHFVCMLWDSTTNTYIPDEMWINLGILKNKRLRFCMELIVVQRLRSLLLKSNFDRNEFDHMLDFLYNFQDVQTIPELSSTSWNLNPSCVNSANYPVAHWSLVTQYAPLLTPFCSEIQTKIFAEFMVRTLVLEHEEITRGDFVTLYHVSESSLHDEELLSLSSLETAVVKQFWKLLGECISHVVGDKLSGVFSWEMVEDHADETDVDKDGTHESEANLRSEKIDMNKAISFAKTIAKAMNDEVSKSAKKRSKEKVNGENVSMVAHLLQVLQRLPCYQFTPRNQVRSILGSLACDVLLRKAALDRRTGPDGQCLAIQLSCREIVTILLQSLLQHREFTVWRVVDMSSLLRWLYYTILEEDMVAAKTSLTNLRCKFLNASKELLRFAIILSLKSPSQVSLTAIVNFIQQLVASQSDAVPNASPETIRCVNVLFIMVSACTEYMEQKGKNDSSLKAARSIISNIVVSLSSFIKSILEEGGRPHPPEESCLELEKMLMKLCGILTRVMKLIPETELSRNKDFADAFEGWTEIVSMLVTKVLAQIDDVGYLLGGVNVSDETTFIEVLEDVFKGGSKQCDFIADELRAQILRKCLEILRKTGFPTGEDAAKDGPKNSSKLQEAVRALILVLLEEDEGRNFIEVLEGVLEWNIKEEKGEETTLNFLTGLSVFRDLLCTKVVKNYKKQLRSITGKIMLSLLSRAAINNDFLIAVLEIVAALVSLGSGVFYPQDLALVFQALALNIEVTSHGSFSRVFMARFAILSWTLFYYPEYVYGAVHIFLPFVRGLLQSLLTQGAAMYVGKIVLETSTLLICAQKMSRLYQEMVSHKDVLSKYSIYFLADCIRVMSTQGVPGTIRDTLVQGVYFLFDICNDDCLTKLHVYLPGNERELFRSLKEDYVKHHKFKGNA